MPDLLVAIVGAPNVGKSRLFNRLTGKPHSIVHDRPGVTRDRVMAPCEWTGAHFQLLDTGGLIPGSTDELTAGVEAQVHKGVQDADLLLFLVDGQAGLTGSDQTLASLLRKTSRPILLVVNKIDAPSQESRISDFFSLGLPDPIAVSAEQGRGLGDLLDSIVEKLPERRAEPAAPLPSQETLGLAIVGKPNVGKSTLFNHLVGQVRSVVSATPGTTRDPVDAEFTHGEKTFRIIDTAGLRRRARAEGETVEVQSGQRALAALKKASLVVLVMDSLESGTHQDLAVLGACQRVLRPLVVALNKSDLVPREDWAKEERLTQIRDRLHFAQEVPVVEISAKTGQGVGELLHLLAGLAEESTRRFSTAQLNRTLETAVRRKSPTGRGKRPKFYYITQTGEGPPSFVVFSNGATVDPGYRRYLARHLRKSLGLELVPISLKFRHRR